MKIGELFVAIGFQVDKKALNQVEKDVDAVAMKAAKLTVIVNAVNAAFIAMMVAAGNAGRSLSNFVKTTGLDPEELQRWEHLGVVTGTTAEAVRDAFSMLQQTRAKFALNEPTNVGVWQLLGVMPTGDPSQTLRNLRKSVMGMDPAIAHELLSRIGLGGITPMLRATEAEFRRWSEKFIIRREQIDQLTRFNSAWGSLKMSISSVRDSFAAALAPAMETVGRLLEWFAEKLAVVTQWLNKGSVVAKVVRGIIIALSVAMLALGAAIAVVTVAIGAMTAAMMAFDVVAWLSGIPEIILAITGYVAAAVAIGTALVLLIDDIVTGLKGGKAVTRDIGEWIASFKVVQFMIRGIAEWWERLVFLIRFSVAVIDYMAARIALALKPLREYLHAIGTAFDMLQTLSPIIASPALGGPLTMIHAATRTADGGKNVTISQQNKLETHINGADKSGRDIAREIGDYWQDQLADASAQITAGGY